MSMTVSFGAEAEGAARASAGGTILVEEANDLEYAGEQTSNTYMCAEQVRTILQEMREGVQAFDTITVNTPEAIQVTLARKCPPAQMQAILQSRHRALAVAVGKMGEKKGGNPAMPE
eukprot:scaffold7700_cov132-Isochrysis_galbana.AAC.6